MQEESSYIETNKRSFLPGISEDVWAVLVGGLLIAIILSGVFLLNIKFITPVYQWENGNDLLSKILTANNLLLLVVIGMVFLSLSSFAVAASGNSIKKYITGFAVIFILAILSLIIAGNKSISYYGVEYVVFGLLIGLLLSNVFSLPTWLKEAARSEFFY